MLRVPSKSGAPHARKFYILEDNHQILQWLSPKKKPIDSRIDLKTIQRIHIGLYGQRLQSFSKLLKGKENQCASIFFQGSQHPLIVIAPDQDFFRFWITGLQLYINDCYFNQDALVSSRLQYYKNIWAEVDSNLDRKLEYKEIMVLVNKLNIDIKGEYLKEKFDAFDKDKNGSLDFEEFQAMMDQINHREELKVYFNRFKNDNTGLIHSQELQEFMIQIQADKNITFEECDSIISKVIKEDLVHESLATKDLVVTRGMDQLDFYQFLFSIGFNGYFNVQKKEVYQDMHQPLNEYFQYSTHNTYLTGHQLKGDSSVEMYKETLLSGCRCVEVDCWDGPNNEPKVTHGFTLTSSITFKSALEAIKETAFQFSPYPVCISLEMHCKKKQQDVIAFYLKSILGEENLYKLPSTLANITTIADIPHYPSPEQLKYKFVIKCKTKRINLNLTDAHKAQSSIPTKVSAASYYQSNTNYNVEEEEKVQDIRMLAMNKSKDPKMINKFGSKHGLDYSEKIQMSPDIGQPRHGIDALNSNSEEESEEEQKQTFELNATEENHLEGLTEQELEQVKSFKQEAIALDAEQSLAALTSMIGAHFKPGQLLYPWEVKSLDEKKILKVTREFGREFWLKHHQSTFTRIYPKGTRFDSSNYQVFNGWSVGAQIVATNFQTKDDFQLMNSCLFEQNGGHKSGYILKTPLLRGLRTKAEINELPTKTITITIISALSVPKKGKDKDIVDPYVTIDLYTTSDLSRLADQFPAQTKVINNNGFNPVWNETFTFDFIDEELNMLVVKIWDADSIKQTVLCSNALNIECLRSGIRAVEMKDTKHKKSSCILLCNFLIKMK